MLDGLTLAPSKAAPPPLIQGTARLAALAFQGWSLDRLLASIGPVPFEDADRAAWLLDRSLAMALTFHPAEAAALQKEALAITRVFRLHGDAHGMRLLAVSKRKLTPTFRLGFDLSRLLIVVGEAVCDGWQRELL
jgi:hypothetical protein